MSKQQHGIDDTCIIDHYNNDHDDDFDENDYIFGLPIIYFLSEVLLTIIYDSSVHCRVSPSTRNIIL